MAAWLAAMDHPARSARRQSQHHDRAERRVTVTGQPGATRADHARMGEAIARPHKSTFSGRLVTSYADRFVGRDSAPIIRHYRQVSFDLLNCKHEKGRLREQAA
jgi:hypothetical protein